MKEYLIRLSWPSRDLSSNARGHWASRSRAVKAYRREAWAMCQRHKVQAMPGAVLEFTYAPPDRRRRDAQNMPHMLKAAIDGIADAMGCDDHGFRCVFPSQFSEPVKGGAVLVHIKPQEERE